MADQDLSEQQKTSKVKQSRPISGYTIYNAEQVRRTKRNDLPSFYPDLPEEKYDIIYADPPWDYNGKMQFDKSGKIKENHAWGKRIFISAAKFKYPTIKTEVLKQIPITLSKDETMESLQAKAVKLGAPALIESLKGLMNGSIEAQEQDHGVATYCKMLGREDAHVDWNESAVQIEAKLRAYHPWPGLWTNWNDLRVKFSQGRATEGMMDPGTTREVEGELYIGTGAGIFAVQEIQIEGSSKQSIEDVLKGYPNLGMTIFR